MPVPLRTDFDAAALRAMARQTKDGPQARRLLALAAIYEGATRTEAAKIGGVGLQIIRGLDRRTRRPRHPLGRPGRLAHVDTPDRAGQHHHHSTAA